MNALFRTTGRGALGAAFVAGALLLGTALAHESSQMSAENPSAQLYASPAQVRLVQEKLRAQGGEPSLDGKWGESTSAAVRDYQRAQGLAPTGQLDTSLLSALEIGTVLEGETSSGFLDGLLRTDDARPAQSSSGRGTPIYVSPVHVAQIQYLLREHGHYSGAVDGAWGPQTARAANKFRAQQGLEANEGIDISLLRTLNQQRAAVPKVAAAATTRTAGVPLHAGTQAVRALQRELAQSGHEAGAVDGVWGENTRQALRDFQREHNLESTGTLTLPTLAALGIDVTGRSSDDIAARTRGADSGEREPVPDAVATREPRRE